MPFSPLTAESSGDKHGSRSGSGVRSAAAGCILEPTMSWVVVGAARVAVAAMAALYAALKWLPTQDKVVLMSRLYASTSDDFAAVHAEIAAQSPSTRTVVLNHRNLAPARVPVQMLVEMYHLATARACITDSYMAAISALRHKNDLVIVQMWHALGAIKRFGLAAVDSPEGRPGGLARVMHMHRGYDWVIAGGQAMVEPFAQAFGVAPARVLPLGTPRVDNLVDSAARAARRAAVNAAYPLLGRRPVVLYAPTFRAVEPVRVDAVLAAAGADEFDVVVSLHPLDRRDFSGRPGAVQDRQFSTLDWLTVADAVITDYSAIVFDAAIVGVPLYFFAYDLEEYRARRGFFVDYEAVMPGPISADATSLMDYIRVDTAASSKTAGTATEGSARLRRFREEFVDHVDGSCTRRIVELIGLDDR